MNENRTYARALAAQYVDAGKPTEWFEPLYAEAIAGNVTIPWADMHPNPNLMQWLETHSIQGQGKTALKVGCGLGDDGEALCQRGFQTVGFDISTSAIGCCHKRFPHSLAEYIVADVLYPPAEWTRRFDFVLEAYTLQVLPPSLRQSAMAQIANFVAPGGQLLVISRGREIQDEPGQMPYPLTVDEVMKFVEIGLSLEYFEDYLDQESPPVRRFRALFR
jgi:ubiquinone/menaquinone biosynthesis C-methylase UbiE